jgi:hypothetical protein
VKRTSDDLRHHVTNFDELQRALSSLDSPCLLEQLEVPLPGVSFSPCPLPQLWKHTPPYQRPQ